MGFIIVIALLVWSFFQLNYALIGFAVYVVWTEGYILLLQLVTFLKYRKDRLGIKLPPEEVPVFVKYYTYFTHPFASKAYSSVMSSILLSTFVWVPWLLYNQYWWQAVVIGINYLFALDFSIKLNPQHFLLHKISKLKNITDIPPNKVLLYKEYERELKLVDSIVDKTLGKKEI